MLGVDGPEIGDWQVADTISEWIEIVAIAVITVSVLAAFAFGARAVRAHGVGDAVERVKQIVGRGLLLGLDLLIAADVIRTVTLEPILENVAALGVLVLVRTFLAWSLMVELTGRWPWQHGTGASNERASTEVGAKRTQPEHAAG
ncbi:MAG: DUF1622 domain-containing protein [Actinomycetota bacterium]|nr:DUF1622 domain-containing protein [Actinomycetota bacterium]